VDSLAAQRAGATIEALLFTEAFKPLMRDTDPLGGYGISYFAQLLASKFEGRD
jgi:hypothetical protein